MKIVFFIILFLVFISKCLPASNPTQNSTSQRILIIKDDSIAPQKIADDISLLGYLYEMINPEDVTEQLLQQFQLTILSTGSGYEVCRNSDMRLALQNHVLGGGKLIIEGGDNGYSAAVFPLYVGFRNKVLKILSWVQDNGGALTINSNFDKLPLAIYPNMLPKVLQINYSQGSDQDVCVRNEFSETFYFATLSQHDAGIIVSPSVEAPQVINFSFSYTAAADPSDRKALLENCLWNLIGEPSGVSGSSTAIPLEHKLYQNFPNPFNPSTVINYDIKKADYIQLYVFNSYGKEVKVLVNGKQNAGSYAVSFDGTNFSSGVYFYKLITGDFSETKKMFLIK